MHIAEEKKESKAEEKSDKKKDMKVKKGVGKVDVAEEKRAAVPAAGEQENLTEATGADEDKPVAELTSETQAQNTD